MTYPLLRYAHLIGLMLLGAGLIGVWMADLRSRKVRDLGLFAEAVRNIAVFYDGVVVPGAIILFVSGAWMTAEIRSRHKAKYMDPIHHRGIRCFSYGNSPDLVDSAPLPTGSRRPTTSRASRQLQAQV